MSARTLPLPMGSAMRMKSRIRARGITLHAGELRTRDLGAGECIEVAVLRGDLWITLEGDLEDHTLQAGDRLMLTGPGKVVIESLEQHAEFTMGEL